MVGASAGARARDGEVVAGAPMRIGGVALARARDEVVAGAPVQIGRVAGAPVRGGGVAPAPVRVGIAVALAVALAAAVGCKREGAPARVSGALRLTITDGAGGPPVAARVLLWDGDAPVRWGTNDLYGGARQVRGACEPAPGVLGTWHGLVVVGGAATIPVGVAAGGCEPLPAGRYRVWVWRGFEHERWEGEVTLGAGEVALTVALERAWRAEGAVAADLHVHAAASNDSGLPDRWRVMAQVAAGVEVIALSDHAVHGDLDQAIAELGLGGVVGSLASNEAGNDVLHVGVYPVPVDRGQARGGSPAPAEMATWTPAQMMAWGRRLGTAERPVMVQVNHPRFRMYSLFDSARWDGVRWPPPFPLDFDAVEVVAGHTAFNAPGDRRLDESVRDFYTFAAHGVRVTGVGGSDTHHLNGVLDGVARTYVLVDDEARRLDDDAVVAALRARRAVATTGPWLDVEVVDVGGGAAVGPGQALRAPSGRVRIDVEIAQARWVRARRVRVLVAGAVAREEELPDGARRHRVTMEVEVTAPTWIGVDAGGDEPLPVEMTGAYQQEKRRPGVVPFAIVNPIWIE